MFVRQKQKRKIVLNLELGFFSKFLAKKQASDTKKKETAKFLTQTDANERLDG